MSMMLLLLQFCILIAFFFFFNDTATTEIYTLSLHDALPIFDASPAWEPLEGSCHETHEPWSALRGAALGEQRSEEHTSELQSQSNLVCRLLLEKKKKKTANRPPVASAPTL